MCSETGALPDPSLLLPSFSFQIKRVVYILLLTVFEEWKYKNIHPSRQQTPRLDTIACVERITGHGEITWSLLYAILVPRTLVVARCTIPDVVDHPVRSPIDTLDALPLRYHGAEARLRGRKWMNLIGCNIHSTGDCGVAVHGQGDEAYWYANEIVQVKGRIMVDRATFHRLIPSCSFPTPVPQPDLFRAYARVPSPREYRSKLPRTSFM
ncbi:hypothetical protein DFH06DRAFT_1423637 [Mycena polygramma]|nr:hypothetical protein DFH06DRAFT_1423637 [Mycena polygramma]